MAGSSGFTVSRAHTGDRHYIPPARRNHLQQQQQQLLLQQQQQQRQLQKPLKSDLPVEADSRTDPAGTALSKTPLRPSSSSSSSPPPTAPPPNLSTNLDRLMKSVTPFVPAHSMPERNWRTRQGESQSFFSLGDLWDTFKEWSVYGVGVPLLLNGKDSVMQYYVPFLSGVQLYKEPSKPSSRLRRASEKSDPESRGASSNGSSDCEIERWAKGAVDGTCNQQNAISLNSQKFNRISLRDNSIKSSSSDEDELLVFEYLEQEQPHHRKPLADKISALASQFPDLRTYRSCDLLPSSWLSVAWYPIYRIPVGPTLQNLDASFLTIHSLSTHFKGVSPSPPNHEHHSRTHHCSDMVFLFKKTLSHTSTTAEISSSFVFVCCL